MPDILVADVPEDHHDHQVPGDLLELYEVLEWEEIVKGLEVGDSRARALALPPVHMPSRAQAKAAGVSLAVEVVSRFGWGAKPPRSVSHNITPGRGGVGLHYEGPTMGTFPHTSCASKVRGIQAFHMGPQRGWVDIAYTSIVCPHGVIFQGRWWGARTAANGTDYGNQNFYAVCGLWGVGDPFTDAAQRAYVYAVEDARVHGGAGHEVKPHSGFKPTACPGDPVRQWIAAGMPIGDYDPVPAPIPTPKVTPMFSPPIVIPPVAAVLTPRNGKGLWQMGRDGSIFAWGGAPNFGGTNGKDYFFWREAANLYHSDDPVLKQKNPNQVLVPGKYVIEATSGELYGPDF